MLRPFPLRGAAVSRSPSLESLLTPSAVSPGAGRVESIGELEWRELIGDTGFPWPSSYFHSTELQHVIQFIRLMARHYDSQKHTHSPNLFHTSLTVRLERGKKFLCYKPLHLLSMSGLSDERRHESAIFAVASGATSCIFLSRQRNAACLPTSWFVISPCLIHILVLNHEVERTSGGFAS